MPSLASGPSPYGTVLVALSVNMRKERLDPSKNRNVVKRATPETVKDSCATLNAGTSCDSSAPPPSQVFRQDTNSAFQLWSQRSHLRIMLSDGISFLVLGHQYTTRHPAQFFAEATTDTRYTLSFPTWSVCRQRAKEVLARCHDREQELRSPAVT